MKLCKTCRIITLNLHQNLMRNGHLDELYTNSVEAMRENNLSWNFFKQHSFTKFVSIFHTTEHKHDFYENKTFKKYMEMRLWCKIGPFSIIFYLTTMIFHIQR